MGGGQSAEDSIGEGPVAGEVGGGWVYLNVRLENVRTQLIPIISHSFFPFSLPVQIFLIAEVASADGYRDEEAGLVG